MKINKKFCISLLLVLLIILFSVPANAAAKRKVKSRRRAPVKIKQTASASRNKNIKRSLTQPILVDQPAYKGMQFYVHRPDNMPSNSEDWFLTYDGYPVYRNWNGVWLYGRFDGVSFTPTAHVVGSVIPKSVGLVPWGGSPSAPLVAPGAVVNLNQINNINNNNFNNNYGTWADSNIMFKAIGSWGKSVDRIGVLTRPKIPLAWKGDKPQVIYYWTGQEWRQVYNNKNLKAADLIRNKIYEMAVWSNKSSVWSNADTAMLSGYASSWGYNWLGQIFLTK